MTFITSCRIAFDVPAKISETGVQKRRQECHACWSQIKSVTKRTAQQDRESREGRNDSWTSCAGEQSLALRTGKTIGRSSSVAHHDEANVALCADDPATQFGSHAEIAIAEDEQELDSEGLSRCRRYRRQDSWTCTAAVEKEQTHNSNELPIVSQCH